MKRFKFIALLFFCFITTLPFSEDRGGAYAQTTPAWNPNPTPGGATSMLFRFTNQVWLNPTIILAKQNFEAATNVKLLILPSLNANDTSGSSRIEKAFDKLLSFLVYKDNIQGSIKFYFDPLNPAKPFTFNTSDECKCKFTPIQKDTVEQLLNQNIANSTSLTNFAALPFDSVITHASLYCKKILLGRPQPCGPDSSNNFTLTKINTTPAKLNFERALTSSTSPNGGVDKQKYTALAQNYNTVLDIADNSNYSVAWKAMQAGNDVIKLKLQKKQPGFDISKLVFKNASATETYNTTFSPDSTISLSFGGKPAGSMAEVVAFYTPPATAPPQTFAIGAFNIQFYQPETLKVVLVNLGTGAMPDTIAVRDTLNKIYGSVFIKWNVDTANCILPSYISKSIHIENSSLLSNYMPDMQPIVSYFKNNCPKYNASDENTYYLLFGCTNDGAVLGYMPRARNAGFIFDVSPHTIAHELGHGAFNLKHIFSSDELGEGNKGLTNNIMDYSIGSTLYKHQWDLIHDPSFVGWFEGDDAEAMSVDNHEQIIGLLNKIKNAVIKNIDMSLPESPAISGGLFLINGIQYNAINIHGTVSASGTVKIHPKNAIVIYPNGVHPFIMIGGLTGFGGISIEVTPPEKLAALKDYLDNLIPTKNLLLFANGYDPSKSIRTDEVYCSDPIDYWEGIDQKFITAIGTKNIVYANGNKSILTSNHVDITHFTLSLHSSELASGVQSDIQNFLTSAYLTSFSIPSIPNNPCYHNAGCVHLNTTPRNTGGFAERLRGGRAAGFAMAAKIGRGEIIFDQTTDEIDIVCHSMGFAYAQGMIEVFKQLNFKIGSYYILAPENAGSGSITLTDFKGDVWQYGSNDNPVSNGGDLMWLQDGVAPQCKAGGLLDNNRAYIPNSSPKGFTESHSIKNYGWIFTTINNGLPGYVKKRN